MNDNVDMDFWKNVKAEIKRQNTTQEWVSKMASIPFETFRGWISRERLPRVDQAVAVARVLNTTVEELVEGENGEKYIIDLVHQKDGGFASPDGFKAVFKALNKIDVGKLHDLCSALELLSEQSSFSKKEIVG